MEKIYAITFWVYVVSVVLAAIFATTRMHEIEQSWAKSDPEYMNKSLRAREWANTFVAALFVFVPLVNTITALTLFVVVLHKVLNRE